MRGPTNKEIANEFPPELRDNKSTKAHQDIRKKILSGVYLPGKEMVQREIEHEYNINNNSAQIILLRLAIEGLINIQPIKVHTRSNNAAYNEYHVADLDIRSRIYSTRQGGFVSDIAQTQTKVHVKTEPAEIRPPDEEIQTLLETPAGESIIFSRSLQMVNGETVIAISDTYLPHWFFNLTSELQKPDADIYQLMIQLGKNPMWCTETLEIVQASSVERKIFALSPDDPAPLFKIIRRVFDQEGHPLSVDFLTDRGDKYRMHYSFPLFAQDVPEVFRRHSK